ncbi:MAG: hypothetical protein Q9208_008498 [Pyrenodesmia sp. 3 TL-2023]
MAETMKGVIIEGVGAPYKVVEDLEVPEPGEGQVLVKSIATAINPVDTYMSSSGLLVKSFPIVLGCDSSGIVTKVGPSTSLKPGQRICGSTRLGFPGYSTFQQYFLFDERFAILPPSSLSYNDAATIGVGAETACIGLLQGIKLAALDKDGKVVGDEGDDKEGGKEWVVVFGGAGSVGQYSVQIAKALGYKVVATCSKRSADLVRSMGADEVVDYTLSEDEQYDKIKELTGGNFFGVWDTVAKYEGLGRKLLTDASISKKRKCYATTDGFTPMKENPDHALHLANLGYIGRPDEESGQPGLDSALVSYAKFITNLLAEGKLKPNGTDIVTEGFEAVPEAVEKQTKGAGGKKVVVELQSVE